MPQERIFHYKSQDRLGECVITALEYATGVHRNTIAAEIGARGSELNPAAQAKKAAGEFVNKTELQNLTGITTEQVKAWLGFRHIEFQVLVPEDAGPVAHADAGGQFVSKSELSQTLDGAVALVSWKLSDHPPIAHLFAWIGGYAIDPSYSTDSPWTTLAVDAVLHAIVLPKADVADLLNRISRVVEIPENHQGADGESP